jgi:hypothetical protein
MVWLSLDADADTEYSRLDQCFKLKNKNRWNQPISKCGLRLWAAGFLLKRLMDAQS